MSILQKVQNEQAEKNQMIERIYEKIKPQQSELQELGVSNIELTDYTGTKSIRIDLKTKNWWNLHTYWISVTAVEPGQVNLVLHLYHPSKSWCNENMGEDQIEDGIARACSFFKRVLA